MNLDILLNLERATVGEVLQALIDEEPNRLLSDTEYWRKLQRDEALIHVCRYARKGESIMEAIQERAARQDPPLLLFAAAVTKEREILADLAKLDVVDEAPDPIPAERTLLELLVELRDHFAAGQHYWRASVWNEIINTEFYADATKEIDVVRMIRARSDVPAPNKRPYRRRIAPQSAVYQ